VAEEEEQSEGGSEARSAGRGVIFIALAKVYFMVLGAVIEFRLPALLGRVQFGAYGVVSSLVSPINNVLIVGTIQAVSRFTAQDTERARAVQRAGLRMHLMVGLPVAVSFAAMMPLFAHFVLHDQRKTGPLMLASAIIAGYSFYAVFVGRANGTRAFHKQAGLDVSFATMRAAGILGLAGAGFGLMGAIGGWVLAVCGILLVSSFVVGVPGQVKERQPMRPLMTFFGSIALYLVLMNLIMVVDQLLLKRMSTEWFVAHADQTQAYVSGVMPSWMADAVGTLNPADAADAQVGYYRAVQNLARLSYQAIIAATFVIFPLVSRSTFISDRETTRRYVSTTMRLSTIFAAAIAVVFAANPLGLLDIPYASDYAYTGAPALTILALGNVAFSVFVIAGTILNGSGNTRAALITVAVTLAAAAVANALVIPRFHPGSALLTACAAATSGAMVLGACLSSWLLHRSTGATISWLTALRVIIAGAAAIALGRFWPTQGALGTMLESCAIGIFFLLVLIVTRELGRDDLSSILALAKRKSRKT
jgi:stage V sporulation protein B